MNGQARARSRPRGVTVAGVVLLVSGALLALGGIYDLVAGESASRPFGC